MSRRGWLFTVLMAGCAAFSLAQAQQSEGTDDPPAQEQRRGDRRAERRGTPRGAEVAAQYRQRMMENVKQQSGASDEEWRQIEPKVEKVLDLQRELRPGFGAQMGRPGARQGARPGDQDARPGAGQQRRPGAGRGRGQDLVGRAQRDLRTALQDTATSADEIRQKLAAFREARQQAQEDLEAAQKELKDAVSPRLEAALVLAGLLE